MKADVRIAEHEGTLVDEAKCPRCRLWAIVSPEQAIGQFAFRCTNCKWTGYVLREVTLNV